MGWVLSVKDYLASPSAEAVMQRYAETAAPELIGKLYDDHGKDLYHYLLTLTDAELAADVAQRTWLRVIEKRHLYQRSGRFVAWLFTMGRNQLMDEFRRTQRLDVDTDKVMLTQDQLASSLETDGDPIALFGRLLSALPFEQKEAFTLQQEGFGLQEIANITHVGVETVKSRLRYARSRLKEQLERGDA